MKKNVRPVLKVSLPLRFIDFFLSLFDVSIRAKYRSILEWEFKQQLPPSNCLFFIFQEP